jgi:hypothetical protein
LTSCLSSFRNFCIPGIEKKAGRQIYEIEIITKSGIKHEGKGDHNTYENINAGV